MGPDHWDPRRSSAGFYQLQTPDAAVRAAADGTVLLADHSHPDTFNRYVKGGCGSGFEDMGNSVILQHSPDTYTVYLHLPHEDPATASSGEVVHAGRRIGWQENTGFSNGPHLHFAVVDVQIVPSPAFVEKPAESWGFIELNGTNYLVVNQPYTSQSRVSP